MSSSGRACIFCGATLCTQSEATWRFEWRSDFRTLYTDGPDWTNVRLSGVGLYADGGVQHVPTEKSVGYGQGDLSMDDLMLILLYKRRLKATATAARRSIGRLAWGFPIHASCWELAEIVYEGEKINKQRLFKICLSFPDSGHRNDWDYDCQESGSTRETRPPGGGQHQERDHTLLCRHDPLYRLAIDDTQVFRLPQARVAEVIAPAKQLDCFGRLPTEIRQMLLEYTPSKDVPNFRLASRSLARTPLPNSFWRSRFSSGNEFEYVFEAREHSLGSLDWHKAYMSLKHGFVFAKIQLLVEPAESLKNRRRIWELLSSLQALLTSKTPKCHGQPIMSDYEHGEHPQEQIRSTASRLLVKSGDLFTSGCRALRTRQISVPSRLTAAYISFVTFRGQKYVSGLQFRSNEDSDNLGVCVGYVVDGEVVNIPIDAFSDNPDHPSLRRLTVAMTMRGICGIRILFQNGQDSGWVGEHEGIPKRRIVIKDSGPLYLRISLDAIKIVALGISSSDDSNTTDSDARLGTVSGAYAGNPDKAFWLPEVPPESVLLGGICTMDSYTERQQQPYTMVLFGGENGEHLSNLTQVLIWASGSYVDGIEFVYDMGGQAPTHRILGVHSRREFDDAPEGTTTQVDHHQADTSTLDIDGPGGERIIQITRHASAWGLLIGLRLCTNFGRSVDINCSDVREHEEELLEAKGRVIVGIYGLLEGKSEITSLGILSQDNCIATVSS